MKSNIAPASHIAVHEAFAQRCAKLGIPCWRMDLESKALVEPLEPAALLPLLRSTVVRSMVQNAANTLALANQPAPLKPLPGWVIAPFVHADGARRVSISVALLLAESVSTSAQFATACASAHLDPVRIRAACEPVFRHGPADLENTLAVLNWMHEDLVRRDQSERAIEQLEAHWCSPAASGGMEPMGMNIAQALVTAIEAKDPLTCGHGQRVSLLAGMMARALALDEHQVQIFQLAGLLHDVGKIAIPEALLTKRTRLSAGEIELIQKHAEIGHQILKDIPLLADALPGVLHHHERFDGFGYPEGLSGENVPLVARVLALADAFDAMSSERAYRAALSRQNVVEEIRRCAGTHFDPALVETFLAMDFAAVDQLLERHSQQRRAA